MGTYCPPMSRSVSPVIFIVVLLAIVLAIVAALPHADLKHGQEANLGRECRNNPNASLFYNPVSGRTMHVCQTSEGYYGVWIEQAGKEITSFVKNKMKRFDQIAKYAENSGYTRIR